MVQSHVTAWQLNTAEQGGKVSAKCGCMRGALFAVTSFISDEREHHTELTQDKQT